MLEYRYQQVFCVHSKDRRDAVGVGRPIQVILELRMEGD